MAIKLLAFAQARDRLGFSERSFDCSPGESPRTLFSRIAPHLDITHFRVAVDQEYRDWDEPIGAAREIAIIPPVSGG